MFTEFSRRFWSFFKLSSLSLLIGGLLGLGAALKVTTSAPSERAPSSQSAENKNLKTAHESHFLDTLSQFRNSMTSITQIESIEEKFSPDGNWVAYKKPGIQKVLFLRNLENSSDVEIKHDGIIQAFEFSENSLWLASHGDLEAAEDLTQKKETWVRDLKNGNARHFKYSGPRMAYASFSRNQLQLSYCDVETNAARFIASSPAAGFQMLQRSHRLESSNKQEGSEDMRTSNSSCSGPLLKTSRSIASSFQERFKLTPSGDLRSLSNNQRILTLGSETPKKSSVHQSYTSTDGKLVLLEDRKANEFYYYGFPSSTVLKKTPSMTWLKRFPIHKNSAELCALSQNVEAQISADGRKAAFIRQCTQKTQKSSKMRTELVQLDLNTGEEQASLIPSYLFQKQDVIQGTLQWIRQDQAIHFSASTSSGETHWIHDFKTREERLFPTSSGTRIEASKNGRQLLISQPDARSAKPLERRYELFQFSQSEQ